MRDFSCKSKLFSYRAMVTVIHVRNVYSMIFDKKNKMQISVRNIEDLATTIDKY